MTRGAPRARVGVALAVVAVAGSLLNGCSRSGFTPAPGVVSAAPQLFEDGPVVEVTSGSAGADQTAGGPLWWFTAPQGVLSVYNGSDQPAVVRVSAAVVIPCDAPAQLTFSPPQGRSRSLEAVEGRPRRVRFAVRVPAQGSVDVDVQIDATPCQPPADSRTLYAGLQSLKARGAGSAG